MTIRQMLKSEKFSYATNYKDEYKYGDTIVTIFTKRSDGPLEILTIKYFDENLCKILYEYTNCDGMECHNKIKLEKVIGYEDVFDFSTSSGFKNIALFIHRN